MYNCSSLALSLNVPQVPPGPPVLYRSNAYELIYDDNITLPQVLPVPYVPE